MTDGICCVTIVPFPWKRELHILTHVAVMCLKLWHLKYKDDTLFTVLMYFRMQEGRSG